MSKHRYKLNITRPEFLLELMGGDASNLDPGNMKRVLHDTNELSYCVYTVLMEANIDPDDITSIVNDGESIALTFKKKAKAESAMNACSDQVVRYGKRRYQVQLKLMGKGKSLIAQVKKLEEQETE